MRELTRAARRVLRLCAYHALARERAAGPPAAITYAVAREEKERRLAQRTAAGTR